MKKRGFTLAEVLITLVIIGIIAAMTIPTLMNKTNEQETVVAVKKAYSTLSQAYQRFLVDYGDINPSYFGSTCKKVTKNFSDEFVKYLNVQKVCGQESETDCWSTENEGWYNSINGAKFIKMNSPAEPYYKIMLSDGTSLSILSYSSYSQYGYTEALAKVWGHFYIDINGYKGPNTFGKDVFRFHITKYSILPAGSPYDILDSPFYLCRQTGKTCAAWVVTKGNMDYLRKDVSW